jgi:hypothetical protein
MTFYLVDKRSKTVKTLAASLQHFTTVKHSENPRREPGCSNDTQLYATNVDKNAQIRKKW